MFPVSLSAEGARLLVRVERGSLRPAGRLTAFPLLLLKRVRDVMRVHTTKTTFLVLSSFSLGRQLWSGSVVVFLSGEREGGVKM